MRTKNNGRNKIALSLLACFLFASISAANSEVLDKVLAVVNDELITQSELDKILNPIYIQYKKLYAGDELLLRMEEKRREVLNHMINDKLILSEARKRDIEIDPRDIAGKIEELKNRFPSEEAFDKALVKEGMSQADLRKNFESELLKGKFIDAEVRAKIRITPTEVKAYYDLNADKFKMVAKARVSDILIRAGKAEDREKARKTAEEVMVRLKAGEAFAELARVYSEGFSAKEGGDMGYLNKGQLKKEFDEVIFSLQKGEFSGIIESDGSCHIFMVTDKKGASVLSLEEAHDEIKGVLYRHKAEKRFKELIEGIKRDAYISIR